MICGGFVLRNVTSPSYDLIDNKEIVINEPFFDVRSLAFYLRLVINAQNNKMLGPRLPSASLHNPIYYIQKIKYLTEIRVKWIVDIAKNFIKKPLLQHYIQRKPKNFHREQYLCIFTTRGKSCLRITISQVSRQVIKFLISKQSPISLKIKNEIFS